MTPPSPTRQSSARPAWRARPLLAALTLLAACGGGNDEPATSTTATTNTSSTSGTGTTSNTSTALAAAAPVTCAQASDSTRVLALINAARAQARNCGATAYGAAAPLRWNHLLAQAATVHSLDMAAKNFMAHTGSDGSSPFDRTEAAGYGRYTGENIAAGYTTLEAALAGLLNSEGHCKNLMNPQYTEIGVACASAPNTQYGSYWTQSFGSGQ